MTRRLDELRQACAEPVDHPGLAQLWHMCQGVVDLALHEEAALPQLDPAATASRSAMEQLLREPAPERGADFADVLAQFRRDVLPHNMRTNHPRFLAFVPAAPSFVSVLGEWLCASTNLFAGFWMESAGAAQVETVVLDWFKGWLRFPDSAGGLLTSGGSEANLTALVAAREALSETARSRAVVYVSDQRHWSIDRAARIIGLRDDQVRVVPSTADFRLPPADLARAVQADRAAGCVPWLVAASAGTTNTGSIDPLVELALLCKDEKLWLHVDAAYGWAAVLADLDRDLRDGLPHADSIALDTHKWFAQTYVAGCLLVRDPAVLRRAFAMRPEYLQDFAHAPDEIDFADHGIALTRRFRALKIWLSIKVLGVAWFRQMIRHGVRLAELAQALLEQTDDFEIVSPRRLSTLCFRYAPAGFSPEQLDAINRALVADINRSGRAFLATTRLRGQTVLRFCFVNWRTTAADVEEVVELLRVTANRCRA
jgi:glutamate/tyrosine decarboxylase-like PLP-dependent enzyme